MRFERLILERYGPFEDAELDLGGDDVRLHVVYGPNEAGKSTILSAIGDVLFGIPARTPFNFRHGYGRLRIGAVIVNAAGQRLAFKRRKANTGTLLTLGASEAALPDGSLAPFLGGADRELFERMFGLDHQRMRQGGERMLRSGGELASSLFEAGSGLTTVGDVLKGIEAEIDALGDLDRRARGKPIWRDIDAFVQANQAVRRDAMRADEWSDAEKQLADARAERQRLDEKLAGLRRRRAELERIRRAAPLLAAIDELVQRLAEQGEGPRLPQDFAAHWRRCDEAFRSAHAAWMREEETVRQLARDIEGIPAPGRVLDLSDAIVDLVEKLGEYAKGVADEPKLRRDIAGDDAQIASHLRSLGLASDPHCAEARMPPLPLVARVRHLIRRGEGLSAALEAAQGELQQADDALAREEAALDATGEMADPADAARQVDAVARLGDVPDELVTAARRLAAAERDLAEALMRLPGWTDTADALATRCFPDLATLADHEQQLRKAGDTRDAAARAMADRRADLRRLEADLDGLMAAGDVPSPAAIQAARGRRDRMWRLVRRRLIERREAPPGEGAALDPDELPDVYEQAVADADALIDRAATEAQRVARYLELVVQKQRLLGQHQVTTDDHARAETEFGTAEERWRCLWQGTGVEPGAPAAMRAWLAQREEVLRCLRARRDAEAAMASAQAKADRARTGLASAAAVLGVPADPSASLDVVEQTVRGALDALQRRWSERQTALAKVADARQRAARKRTDLAGAAGRMREWQTAWDEIVVALGLPAEAGPAEADAALAVWDQIRDRLTNRAQSARRLEGIGRDLAAYRDTLMAMVRQLGGEAADLDAAGDPAGTVRALAARLKEAERRSNRHTDLKERLAAAEAARDRCAAVRREAAAAVAELRARYGFSDEDDPLAVAERVELRQQLESDLAAKRLELANAGDGLGERALRAEVGTASPDATIAELAALRQDEDRLVQDSQTAAQRETTAQAGLDRLSGRKGVAGTAQQARNAALTAGVRLERWVRLTAAKRMLERALDRYRAENQHPLVRRASELFAAIARTGENPIERLDVSYGDGGEPTIVGVRRDQSLCGVDGMSEGTRDQLFLALRIAAVEARVAEHEPLPFIADDLFITSDDQRVLPGLMALAELGRVPQVILFTHHRHVMAAATTLPPAAVRIHRLPVPPQAAAVTAVAS